MWPKRCHIKYKVDCYIAFNMQTLSGILFWSYNKCNTLSFESLEVLLKWKLRGRRTHGMQKCVDRDILNPPICLYISGERKVGGGRGEWNCSAYVIYFSQGEINSSFKYNLFLGVKSRVILHYVQNWHLGIKLDPIYFSGNYANPHYSNL